MTQPTHPPKEAVRDYMADRAKTESPPPKPEEIRRQLGWRLLPMNGQGPEVQR